MQHSILDEKKNSAKLLRQSSHRKGGIRMDILSEPSEAAQERYDNHCFELSCIERKLERGGLSKGKEQKLLFRQDYLTKVVIPRHLAKMQ
jgi:hypothetical protein